MYNAGMNEFTLSSYPSQMNWEVDSSKKIFENKKTQFKHPGSDGNCQLNSTVVLIDNGKPFVTNDQIQVLEHGTQTMNNSCLRASADAYTLCNLVFGILLSDCKYIIGNP